MQIPTGGHWPRFFYYAGNDAGFAQWSQEREIESFFWAPQKDVSLDFAGLSHPPPKPRRRSL